MRLRSALLALACLLLGQPGLLCAADGDSPREPARLTLDHLDQLKEVTEARISPDGGRVVFTVSGVDADADESRSGIWMADWGPGAVTPLAGDHSGAYHPRWSPNGSSVAFISGHGQDGQDQVWLFDTTQGTARRLTDLPNGVSDFAWSPEGSRIVAVTDTIDERAVTGDAARPMVIDRYHFKMDGVGYLGDSRKQLQLVDLGNGAARALTDGAFDSQAPAWSPDGSRIAFVSKRGEAPDRHDNWDIYLVEARAGAKARPLTRSENADSWPEGWGGPPRWSPNGQRIVHTQTGEQALSYYALDRMAFTSVESGDTSLSLESLDRIVMQPRYSPDGAHVYFMLEDDMSIYLARMPAGGGEVERLTAPGRVVRDFDIGPSGRVAVVLSTPEKPFYLAALENGKLRELYAPNADWLGVIELGTTRTFEVDSPDGTRIHGMMLTPPGYRDGDVLPAILRIHGGPVYQYQAEFDFEGQLLAASGYLVFGVNPRGSSGRGVDFQKAIFADYGFGDVPDVLAAVDYVVAEGLADPERLGVGGWSYGGMMTNYVIASDPRFRAAVSGSGISNMLAGYGTDSWVRHWIHEFGAPWENIDIWLKLSYPFLHADRITTPTLFLCGALDMNVPLLGSEQMYQALRQLGVETQLIIYPGEYHSIGRPSFRRDRLQRYVDWYDRWLKTESPTN